MIFQITLLSQSANPLTYLLPSYGPTPGGVEEKGEGTGFFQRVFSQRFLTLAANVVISAEVKKRSPLQRLLENNSGCLENWVVSMFA